METHYWRYSSGICATEEYVGSHNYAAHCQCAALYRCAALAAFAHAHVLRNCARELLEWAALDPHPWHARRCVEMFPRALRALVSSMLRLAHFTFFARNSAGFSLLRSLLRSLLWSLLSSLLCFFLSLLSSLLSSLQSLHSSPPPFRLSARFSPPLLLRSRLCLLFCSRLRLSLRFVPASRLSRATSTSIWIMRRYFNLTSFYCFLLPKPNSYEFFWISTTRRWILH